MSAETNGAVTDEAVVKEGYDTDVCRLATLFEEAKNRPQSVYVNGDLNRNERYNYWEGKSWDARRWRPNRGDSEVLPWKGASDLPVPMIDGYINEDVALAVLAFVQGNITASGHTANDQAFGQRITNVIQWMLKDEMTELNREINLLANYHFERGKGVLGVFWERQVQMGYQELTLAMVAAMAQAAQQQLDQVQSLPHAGSNVQSQGGEQSPSPALPADEIMRLQELAALPVMISDPEYEDRLVELLGQYAAALVQENFKEQLGEYAGDLVEEYELKPKTARRVVKELREKGKSQFPVPTVVRNRPVFVSLVVGEDFFASDAGDMENSRALFWIEDLTAEQLRERVVSQGWDKDWVEYVIEKGTSTGPALNRTGITTTTTNSPVGSVTTMEHGASLQNTEDKYWIAHGYEKRSNEDGVPGIYYTVFHPALAKAKEAGKPECAKSELLNYQHGEYPFIWFRREFLSRRLDDSRGYGEIGYTWQRAIKKQLDSQIDRTDLTTIPPLHHPKGRPPSKWGPGVKVPGLKSEYAYADTPRFDPGSDQVIELVRSMADRYHGRNTKDGDPQLAQVLRQHMVGIWLDGCRLAITQMFQLMQQFLPEQFYYRVVGSAQGQSIRATRAEIQGKFSVSVKFDVQRLDLEAMKQKAKSIIETVQVADRNGITDYNELLAMILSWIDPDVPERILRPAEAASQQERDDEQAVFAKLWAGVGVDVKPGQAYQQRIEVLQDALFGQDQETGEPKNPAGIQRYNTDPGFKKLFDTRMQMLKFQVEQRQVNATTGKLGAPSMEQSAPAPQPGQAQGY